MAILAQRHLLTFLLLFSFTSAGFAQSDPNDTATRELQRPDTNYLRDHPGATALKHRQNQLRFRNPNGTKTVIIGGVTRRDLGTGDWLANAPILSVTRNGWRLDGTSNSLVIRKAGASIRYTIDGSTPNSSTGTLYTAAIAVNADATIKAIAYKTDWLDSAVATTVYTITGTIAAPTFAPAAGVYTSARTVTLTTSSSGAAIRYTTDGSAPSTTEGAVYTSPIPVNSTTTIKAIAYKTNWADSPISSADYTITGTVSDPKSVG